MPILLPSRPQAPPQGEGPREHGLFVPPEALFPGLEPTEATLTALLSTLSRDAVLLACGRLNTIVSGIGDPDPKSRQERAIRLMCSPEDLRRINAFAEAHPESGLPNVFFRGQLLELMRWAVRYCLPTPREDSLFNDPAARTQLLQAALIASTLWSNRVFADRLSATLPIDQARQRALGTFRRALEESVIAPHIATTLGRGWALFSNHFPHRYPAFAKEFFNATGLSFEQNFACVAALAFTFLPFDIADGPVFNGLSVAGGTAYREIFPAYLALESQTPDQLAVALWNGFAKHGYRALRERPMLVLTDGRAVILDPVFLCEKIAIGPVFHLLAHARGGRANEIFGAFGLAFEDYANGVLRRMYPERTGLASRLRCSVTGRDRKGCDFEIDAVLNDMLQVVVFETKAAWLRDEVVLGDSEEWLKQIRSRYGIAAVAADGRKERPKGIAQLAQLVRRILDADCGVVQPEFDAVEVIYPVLLVHDTRLNAPAYGTFLAREFLALLGTIPPTTRIMPLTVMTITDLEYLESSIDRFSMRQLLADYAAAHPDGLVSLHNFMMRDPRYADKIKLGAQLIENAKQLLQHAQREMFPDSPSLMSSAKRADGAILRDDGGA